MNLGFTEIVPGHAWQVCPCEQCISARATAMGAFLAQQRADSARRTHLANVLDDYLDSSAPKIFSEILSYLRNG